MMLPQLFKFCDFYRIEGIKTLVMISVSGSVFRVSNQKMSVMSESFRCSNHFDIVS